MYSLSQLISPSRPLFLFNPLLVCKLCTCGKQLCPVCACACLHVHFSVQTMGTSCGQQLCVLHIACVCVRARICRCWHVPILRSSCVFSVCLVMDSCLVAGDDFRSQADSQPGRRPGGGWGERSPVRCEEGQDWALTQPGHLLCWKAGGSGGTQLWVSVFIQAPKPAKQHRQLTDD